MPRFEVLQNNFTAGELSPYMVAREDFARYQHGLAIQENFITLLEGGLQKRAGTRYVAACKFNQATRLAPFDFRNTDALVLEIGHQYIRFYKNGVRVEVAGVPVEVATPYDAADVFALRLNQRNDVVYLTHRLYAPRKLQRLSDTSWQLSTVTMRPPPTIEMGRNPATIVTLGAVSGSGVSATAASATWLLSDIDREITYQAGLAVIVGYTSTTVVTVDILDVFAGVTLPSGQWTLQGSPVAQLKPSKASPLGATGTATLLKEQAGASELVTDGDFSGGLASWTNYSGGVVASGTHDGAANSAFLSDSGADFLASGVQPTHTLANGTDGSSASVAAVSTLVLTGTLGGGTENDWDIGDTYEVRRTGTVDAPGSGVTMLGGTAGVAWIEQGVTTVIGQTYRLTCSINGYGLGIQIGNTAQAADVTPEAFFDVGEAEVVFAAENTTSYIQFRSNQNFQSSLNNVSVKVYGVDGWRASDVGKHVYLPSGGLLKIIGYTDAQMVTYQIIAELESEDAVAPGLWTLEEDAWDAAKGYPGLSCFHEQRLIFGSSLTYPQTVWGSASGDYENHARGSNASDAFSYDLANARGLLQWMAASELLLIGAENGEFRMAGQNDGPIVASSVPLVRPLGDNGSTNMEPIVVGISVLFAQRQGVTLRELAFQQASLTSRATDLSRLSGHLLEGDSLTQMAYAKQPFPVVWLVRSDGTLLGLTYDRDENVVAWHRHTMGGDGAVRSLASIPHPTANAHQTWMVVERAGAWSVQVFDDTAHGVDACRVVSGGSTTTLTGLTHLNGLSVVSAGIPTTGTRWQRFPAQVVSSGQITLPVACSVAYAGLPFTGTATLLPPALAGNPMAIRRKRKRWQEGYVVVHQSGVGLAINGQPVAFAAPAPQMDDGLAFFTGEVALPNLGWGRTVELTLTHDTPFPCTILAAGGAVEVGDN